jgi:hypothetical protein
VTAVFEGARPRYAAHFASDGSDFTVTLGQHQFRILPDAPRPGHAAELDEPRPECEPGVLAAEIEHRGLVRRDNSNSSRHTGVSWNKTQLKWLAQISHGGKQEYIGLFATEEEAKARYDARCLELGQDPDAGKSSGLNGVTWDKPGSKWKAQIRIDGKDKHLGCFEASACGEVDAALAFDAASRAAVRPERANFEAAMPEPESDALAQLSAATVEAPPAAPVPTKTPAALVGAEAAPAAAAGNAGGDYVCAVCQCPPSVGAEIRTLRCTVRGRRAAHSRATLRGGC